MEQQRGKYLMRNTIIFAIGNFGTKIISFFLVPLYTNVLSTSDYGTVDLVYTIGAVLVPLLTLNIAESIMRFSLDENADHDKIMSIGLLMLIAATVIGILVFPIGRCFESLSSYVKYIYFYTIAFACNQVLLCYLRGKELLLQYSIGNIIQSLCIAVFNILLLLGFKKGIEGYFLAYIFAYVVSALYAFIVGDVIHVLKKFKIDLMLSKRMVGYSAYLIPNSFMWWIMNSLDRVMLTVILGTAANGIFAIAYKIPTLLSTFTNTFTTAWSYSAIREKASDDSEKYSNVVYDNLVSVVVMVAAGMLMCMKVFLKYYVEEAYYVAWKYTPYLTIGFVFMTLGTFIATSYSVYKDSKGMLKSAICGAFVNVILNWILIKKTGIAGAAIATCISYIVVFLYRVFDTRKYLKLKVFQKKHLFVYTFLIIMAFTMFIENWVGQFLLIMEFICVLIINRKCVAQLIRRK